MTDIVGKLASVLTWVVQKHDDGLVIDGRVIEEARAALAEAKAAPMSADPCPGCQKGRVCRTPKCGRLKLPIDHPYRTGITAPEGGEG